MHKIEQGKNIKQLTKHDKKIQETMDVIDKLANYNCKPQNDRVANAGSGLTVQRERERVMSLAQAHTLTSISLLAAHVLSHAVLVMIASGSTPRLYFSFLKFLLKSS
jgi:Flp pilus assembly protein TadB